MTGPRPGGAGADGIDVALIGHLESPADYAHVMADAGARADALLPRIVAHLDPAPLCDFRATSIRGGSVTARYIDLFLLVETADEIVGARRKLARACVEARRTGARIAALGGFASVIGERDRDLSAEHGLAFTTGNTLTAAVVAAQTASVVEAGAMVTVVGAAGDVGSGVCRALHRAGHRLTLVGRAPKPLDALQRELPGAEVASLRDALPRSDAVVLVASAARSAIDLDALPAHARVLDAGHPRNAACRRAFYARAGRVAHDVAPTCDLPRVLALEGPAGETHACLAEATVLAFEGRLEPYSRGRGHITTSRIDEMLAMAARHGVRPAALAWERPEGVGEA